MWPAPISFRPSSGAARPARPAARLPRRILAAALFLTFAALVSRAQSASFQNLAAQAAAARDQQNLPAALALYAEAVQQQPDWQEGWWYLGLLHYSSNQYPQAIDAFSHLLALAPHAAPAMALRGLCEYETGAYDDALRDLDMAVGHGAANEPRNEEILRTHLADLLTRAGRFQDALVQYTALAKKNIESPAIDTGLGLAGMRLAAFVKEVPPTDKPLFDAAGKAGFALLAGKTEDSAAQFQQVFLQFPKAPNVHLFYGLLLFKHDPTLAAEQFRNEVAVNPGSVDAHALLAYSLMMSGRYAEAAPEAQKALAQQPDMEIAQVSLARSLIETGDEQRGMDLVNQILKQHPNNLEAHLALASAYAHAGRNEDAYRERMACMRLAEY